MHEFTLSGIKCFSVDIDHGILYIVLSIKHCRTLFMLMIKKNTPYCSLFISIFQNLAVVEQSSDFSDDNDSEHCSDSDSDNSDADECLMGKVTENNLRISKRTKHKPDIVDLSNKLEHTSEVDICDLNGDNG